TEVGVLAAAIARVPAGVDVEFLQVCEPPQFLVCASCLGAGQRAKFVQVDRLGTLRHQVGVEEGGVAQLIVGVIGDVLGHVGVDVRERCDVGRISSGGSTQFLVLGPEIALDKFGGG